MDTAIDPTDGDLDPMDPEANLHQHADDTTTAYVYHDTVTGEEIPADLIQEARAVEMT